MTDLKTLRLVVGEDVVASFSGDNHKQAAKNMVAAALVRAGALTVAGYMRTWTDLVRHGDTLIPAMRNGQHRAKGPVAPSPDEEAIFRVKIAEPTYPDWRDFYDLGSGIGATGADEKPAPRKPWWRFG